MFGALSFPTPLCVLSTSIELSKGQSEGGVLRVQLVGSRTWVSGESVFPGVEFLRGDSQRSTEEVAGVFRSNSRS